MSAELLPCDHPIADSLFTAEGGGQILIVHGCFGPNSPPIVWCTQGCGWVGLTGTQYEELREVRV